MGDHKIIDSDHNHWPHHPLPSLTLRLSSISKWSLFWPSNNNDHHNNNKRCQLIKSTTTTTTNTTLLNQNCDQNLIHIRHRHRRKNLFLSSNFIINNNSNNCSFIHCFTSLSLLKFFQSSCLASIMLLFICLSLIITTTLSLDHHGTSSSSSSTATASSSSSSSSSSSQSMTSLTNHSSISSQDLYTSQSQIISIYTTGNHSINITHLAMDHAANLYAGGTNWLFQLNSSLTVMESVRTGPIPDSPLCSPTDCSGVDESSIQLRNNINKVLVVDEHSNSLLVCGTVHQGACRKHRLGAIIQSDELIPLPVAANDENSSTLAFVGPSRYNGNIIQPVLYVAVTDSRLGPYRDMVPAISSRSLESGQRYLSIIEKSFTDTAKVDIEIHMKDYFLVNYIYGFSTPDFVYFATVQKRSHLRALEEWGFHSRLARVCQSDPTYNTYAEVTVECIGADGQQYSLLQDAALIEAGDELAHSLRVKPRSKLFVGAFSAAIEHTSTPDTRSAICIYTLQEIEQKFAQNIHMCYNGSITTRNMDYIAGNIPNCPAKRINNIISFCSETLKINGSLPIVRMAAATFSQHTLTSILGQVTTGSVYNVLFVGTHDGLLKKLLISGPDLAEEFDQVNIDSGHRILPDMFMDNSGKYLFVASPYVIAKVAIEHCPHYGNCRSCLNSRNPYCGWCSLQKSCTLRSNCLDTRTSVSSRWLSVDSSKCIEFQSIYPEFLPINSLDKVKLIINQLPRLPANVSYQCVFGSNEPIQAESMPNGLICQSPPVSLRPRLPEQQDFVSIDLAIRPSDTRTDFLQRKFIFYDCNFYKTCTGCVQSRWSCQWCFKENRCVSSGYLCGRNFQSNGNYSSRVSKSTYRLQQQQQQSNVVRHRNECPSFNFTTKQMMDIILPNGVAREISLPVQNLAFENVMFGCLIQIENIQSYVSARISNGHIVCASTKFSYDNDNATSIATVTAVWNKVQFIDRINITLYKCQYLGSHNDRADCSICLNLDRIYDCAWCGSQCSHVEQCNEQRSMICPPPRIDLIHPLSGPVQGGTVVTVEGSNLGVNIDEICDKILIGGYPCHVENFTISVQFTCITQPVQTHFWADVVVGNRAGFTTARDKFLYAVPEVLAASPNSGPQSGGTRIYITGNNLSIGTSLEVYLDEYPCIVDKMLVSSTQISCRTTASKYASYEVDKLYIKIDNATLTLPSRFRYVPDPTIMRIYPLKSYVSGGRSVTVIGTNFDVIQQPRLAIFSVDGLFINDTVCEVVSSSQMICPSPPVNAELVDIIYREQIDSQSLRSAPSSSSSSSSFTGNINDHLSTFEKISFRIGFIMDWVMSVRDLSVNYSTIHSDLIYVPDPKAFSFEEGIKDYKGDSLVIEGENLRLATSESEINVTIGNRPCNLTSLAPNQIVCIPPETQPEPTDEFGRRTAIYLPLVVVRIGNNLRYEIGYLRYDSAKGYELSLVTIGLIVIFSLVLIVFVLVSFVFMRHKSLLAEREYKRIQMQMDTLENSVRSECKQAFAELQTDMTDLSNDLENCGVPILEYRNYVMKVFFPGVDDHPLFQPRPRQSNGSNITCAYNIYELAMAQFEQLIYNKSFLICFLNTLENSPSFNIRDRVNVASLLMVILMERMEYATDVLRTLLLQLVEKSVTSKYPQLMLRRTESVVEKMLTNWLALTMYDYMKNYAGSQLFMLFSAIKHQIEKGPIDVITHDARYSLSEERLLREHYSNYEQLILQVFQPEKPLDKYHIRVNDCDTINQVKTKILDIIYKNTPFSMRLSIHEFDLEWRDQCGNHILLHDIDSTSKREHHGACWQRLNTLKHYNVKNMSLVMLITKNSMLKHQTATLYMTNKKSAIYPLLASSPISCQTLNGFSTDVDNDRFWHLVKPSFDDMSKESSSSSSGSVLMHKAIPEIFLTRLLSTKGTIQKFIDDFFHTILVVNDALPVSIKWIFDLLDEAAIMYNIIDPDVVHAWKSNCLPLRFWVNFIKNPNFIVDVNKTPTIDSNLSVIAQTLMDSCSSSDHRLGKDSPSSKLLFAKDIVNYRRLVMQFYQDVYHLPPVSEQTLFSHMQNLNMAHVGQFDTVCALKELFVYAVKYHADIMNNLQQSDYLTKQQSLDKFINLINYKF